MRYEPILKPEVTAVVPVYNEADCVADCISSLKSQDMPPAEIIVVDDGSSDASAEICRRLGARVLNQDHKGPGSARNLGVKEASGNIIIFADADMAFGPGYVSALARPLVSGEAAGSTHAEELVANWENPWARVQTWFLGCPDRKRADLKLSGPTTVYRAVRKDFFTAHGGFAENEGRADDASLAARSGELPAVAEGAECWHRNVNGPADAFLDARWRGRDMGSRIKSLPEFLTAVLVHRNPLRDLAAGLRLLGAKREPRAPLYAAVFSAGFLYGLFSAYFTGNYLK